MYVQRQLTPTGIAPSKAHSKGWVACFDRDAAQMLVADAREIADGERLALGSFRNLSAMWRANGIPGVTMKDLSRASLYHLGHHTELGLLNVQMNARHRYTVTTEAYLLRPHEVAARGELDLDK